MYETFAHIISIWISDFKFGILMEPEQAPFLGTYFYAILRVDRWLL